MSTPYNVNIENSKTICTSSGCKFVYLYTAGEFEIVKNSNMITLSAPNLTHKINNSLLPVKVYIIKKSRGNNLTYSYDNDQNQSNSILGEMILIHAGNDIKYVYSIPIMIDDKSSVGSSELKNILTETSESVNVNLNNILSPSPFLYYEADDTKTKCCVSVLYGGGDLYYNNKKEFEAFFSGPGAEEKPSIPSAPTGAIQYNQYGPQPMGASSKFINCVPQYDNSTDANSDKSQNEKQDTIFKLILGLAILLSCLAIIVFVYKTMGFKIPYFSNTTTV